MAVTIFGIGTHSGGQTTTPVSLNIPASTAAGDIGLIITESGNAGVTPSATGWTSIASADQAAVTGRTLLNILAREFDGSEGTSVSVAMAGTINHWTGQVIVIRGASVANGNPSTDIVVSTVAQGAAAATGSANSISVSANAGILTVAGTALDATSTTVYSNWANATTGNPTEQIDQAVITGNGGGFGAAFVVFAAGGSTGTTTWDQTSEAWNGYNLGFNEAAAPGPAETRVFRGAKPNVFFTPPRAKIVSIPFPPPPTVTGQASGIIRLRSTSTATVTTPPPPAATSLWVVRGGVFK